MTDFAALPLIPPRHELYALARAERGRRGAAWRAHVAKNADMRPRAQRDDALWAAIVRLVGDDVLPDDFGPLIATSRSTACRFLDQCPTDPRDVQAELHGWRLTTLARWIEQRAASATIRDNAAAQAAQAGKRAA
ncbi:MAG: hypothetical protein U5M50_04125 [Sphingobium sp.]|nr:hypothetical protein [Sphingobium sp.]